MKNVKLCKLKKKLLEKLFEFYYKYFNPKRLNFFQ